MAFRFTLAAVLKLRESLEKQEYSKLLKVRKEIADLEGAIQARWEHELLAEEKRKTELGRGMPASHLQDFYEKAHALQQQREILKVTLKETEKKREEQLKRYRGARQGREMLEKLREQQYSEYLQEKNKQEQALVDDLFLARLKRHN
jgi:flagellar export protein FliJ